MANNVMIHFKQKIFISKSHFKRADPWARKLSKFFVGQGLVQIVSFVSSFALLRWMSVEDYAAFTLAWSIQSLMMAFGDLGIGGSVVPLAGAAGHDPKRLGDLIAAGRELRKRVFPVVVGCGVLAFWFLGRKHGVALPVVLTMCFLACFAVWINASTLFYSAPLVLRQQIGYIQIQQNVIAMLRLAAYGIAHLVGYINAALPLLVNTGLQFIQLGILKKKCHEHICEPTAPAISIQNARKEIVRFLYPQWPILIFNTFQGQITILVVSLVGTTSALAEIGAVSRLNAIFVSLSAFYGIIVVPYFSRVEPTLATRRAFQVFIVAVGSLTAVVFVGFHFPRPFVWILGANYNHLESEIGWTLLSFGSAQLAGLMAAIVYARRIVPRLSIAYIAIPVLACQLLGASCFPPVDIRGAILLTLWTNLGSIFGYWVLYLSYRNKTNTTA
jgi:O-antigen/teichoic acid export membrane protein